MLQVLIVGLVIVVAGIVVFLAFFAHYIFEALREHGQVRQVIDEKDLSEIRQDIEGLSARLLENSAKAEGMVKDTEQKTVQLQEQLASKIKEAEQMLDRLENCAVADLPRVEGEKIEELKSKVKEIEDIETENRGTGDGASGEPVNSAPVVAVTEEIDLEKELLGDKSEKDSGDSVDKFPPEKMDEVLKLAADGVTSVEIARQVGLEPGEVELIVNLRGKAQSE